jgi:predicted PurR-regulated permease PerM
MDLGKENIKKLRGLIIFTILILVGLQNFGVIIGAGRFLLKIIYPFALGAAVAFVLNVPMHFLEKHIFQERSWKNNKVVKKLERPLSLVLTMCLVLGIVGLVMFVVIPQLGSTIMSLGTSLQNFVVNLQDWGEKLFQDNQEIVAWINSLEFNWEKMIQTGIDFFKNGAGSVLNSTFSAAKTIISGLANFFIAFVFACYILLQKEKLSRQVKKIMYAFLKKEHVNVIMSVCSLSYKTFSNFLTGQCVEAVILGTMFFIAMTIFRFPYAMLVGVLIAFTALIPIFGAFIGCVIGAFLILMVSPVKAIGFIVMFLILQQIEGNLIYPHVVGGSVGLPSIWVLVAVTLGGSLMGIVGMLVFIPLSSVVYTLFRGWVYQRLKKKNIKMEQIE